MVDLREHPCYGEEENAFAAETSSSVPTVDGVAASLTDWTADESVRGGRLIWPPATQPRPEHVFVLTTGDGDCPKNRRDGRGRRTDSAPDHWVRRSLRRSWRGSDVGFCAVGRMADCDVTPGMPGVRMDSLGMVASLRDRRWRIRALSDLLRHPWSRQRGYDAMRMAVEVRFLVEQCLRTLNTGKFQVSDGTGGPSPWDILGDCPLPWYPEYPVPAGMQKVRAPPSLWWSDRHPVTLEPYGPTTVTDSLLLPRGWDVADLGGEPSRRSTTYLLGRGDRQGAETDPWACRVLEVDTVTLPVVVPEIDLECGRTPNILIDNSVASKTAAAMRGFIVVGLDAGTAVTPAEHFELAEATGAARDYRVISRELLPTVADSMEVDDSIFSCYPSEGMVDPTWEASDGWLSAGEIVAAMNVDAFFLRASGSTGSYAQLRHRELSNDGGVCLAPLPVGLVEQYVIRQGRTGYS